MDDEKALALIINMQELLKRYGVIGIGIEKMRDYVAERLSQATTLEDKLGSMDVEIQKLQDEVDMRRYERDQLKEENKKLKDLVQKLQVAPVQQEYDYRVTRTHDDYTDSKGTKDLNEFFDAGYEFVHASEFVQAAEFGKNNYIEYIVRKKRQQV